MAWPLLWCKEYPWGFWESLVEFEMNALSTNTEKRAKHILIVEDNVALRFTTSEWLRAMNYIVYEAATADEALVILGSSMISVDLVVTDVEMPGSMNGFGLMKHIAIHTPHIDVIVVSGNETHRELREQAVVFFKKPYDLPKITKSIETLITARSAGVDHGQP